MVCIVRVVACDVGFLLGLDCFWSGTQTEEGTEKQRRVQFCKLFFRVGRCCCCHVLMCPKFLILCAVGVCDFVAISKGLISEECSMVFEQNFVHGTNLSGMFPFQVWAWWILASMNRC